MFIKFSLHIFLCLHLHIECLSICNLNRAIQISWRNHAKNLVSFPVIMAKTNFKIGIIYQCYIYFPNWNVIIYVIHKSMFVTVKSFLMLIIMTYIIHKSVFCNSQGLVNLIFDSFLVQLETWFNT